MFTKQIVVSALIAAGIIGTVAIPAQAADIYVVTPPPAAREEVVPAPRTGYVWAPGHYEYRDNYTWVPGTWEAARPGHVYRAPAWVEREGRWTYQPPRWDRDGDGVSNRNDNYPNNPNYR